MHLCWDEKGNRLLVTDPEHNQVLVLSEQGETLKKIPVNGFPIGIAVAPDSRVLATLRQGHKVVPVPMN